MSRRHRTLAMSAWLCACAACATGPAAAGGGSVQAVSTALPGSSGPATDTDAVDLAFREFFEMPVGPRGLVPSAKLLALDGHRVRLVGFMARPDSPARGVLILAPLPVTLDDEDESLADDLPASAVHAHLDDALSSVELPFVRGALTLTGTLQLGSAAEADGRRSNVRLLLDDASSRALVERPNPHAIVRPMNDLSRPGASE